LFARRPDADARGISYLFKGFATAARKISHVDVWSNPREANFQNYLNLLIRPATGGTNRYRHWEPADDHLDWLWRVCGPMRGRRNLFGVIGGTGRFVNGVTRLTDGSTIHAQQNYVIFSDSKVETMILSTPIEVAWSPPIRDRSLEEWLADDRVQRIRELVIGKASTTTFGQRGLKTTNDQQAMQHLVLDNVSDVAGWRTAVRSVVTS